MKNRSVLFVIVALTTGVLFGAKPGKGEPCAKLSKIYGVMKDSLNLSSEQDLKIRTINDTACAHMQEARKAANGDKDAMKTAAHKVMAETREAYGKVLTPEQQKKMKEIHKERNKGANKNPAAKAEKMTEKMKTELSLDADQTKKVGEANLELVNRMTALKEKRDAGADSTELRTQGKLVHKEYDAKMKAILSDAQYTKFKEMKKEAGRKMQKRRSARKPE